MHLIFFFKCLPSKVYEISYEWKFSSTFEMIIVLKMHMSEFWYPFEEIRTRLEIKTKKNHSLRQWWWQICVGYNDYHIINKGNISIAINGLKEKNFLRPQNWAVWGGGVEWGRMEASDWPKLEEFKCNHLDRDSGIIRVSNFHPYSSRHT